MMTSWHGNAFRITGPLWGESNTDGVASQRASHAEIPLLQSVEKTLELSVIWDSLVMRLHGKDLIQYKDVVLPVKEIPLWR